jgi:hypothetical protein
MVPMLPFPQPQAITTTTTTTVARAVKRERPLEMKLLMPSQIARDLERVKVHVL